MMTQPTFFISNALLYGHVAPICAAVAAIVRLG